MRLIGAILTLLFGLAFAGGGLFLFSKTGFPMWQDWRAMQDWQPATARLMSVSGSERHTAATYRYHFDGVVYEGDRVYISTFKDNIGSYHRNMRALLERHERSGNAIKVWVDPGDPSQSVIDRDMRWGLFALISGFCGVFMSIGLLVCYAGLRTTKTANPTRQPSLSALRREWKQQRQDTQFNLTFPEYAQQQIDEFNQRKKTDEPRMDWRTRKGWETPTIRSEAKLGVFVIWGFAIVWNALSSPLLFVLPEEIHKGNYLALIGLLFPLVGVILLYQAVRSTMEYRRFGHVLFEMDPYPGAIGGHVGGHIHVSRLPHEIAAASDTKVTARLECIYSYMSGSGKDRSRREDIKWAEQGTPQIERAAQGVKLAFRFNVPDNLPEADAEQSGAFYYWRLSLAADIPGVNLNRQYNIPVMHTRATSRSVRHDISAQVAQRKEQESEAVRQHLARGNFAIPALSRAMDYNEAGGEIRISFPMFRNKVLTVFAAIFAGGFGFATYSMSGVALKGGLSGLLMALFSIPFVLVAIAAGIATIYLMFNNLRVHIARNEISVLRRLLFIPVFRRRLNVTDIAWLAIKKTGSTGQGVDKIEHFKIVARDRAGKSVTLAEDLDGKEAAGHFRDYLAGRLNVETRADPLPPSRLRPVPS